MTAGLVGQNQVATFTTPVNGTSPIDANQVRGNDNTIKTSYDAHDSDGTIHLQSSTLGSRPAAGTAGRKWLTTDTLRVYYDNGVSWDEVAYITSAGGTITGNIIITGTLEVDGNFSVATTKFTVAAATGNTLIAGTLGVTGQITGNLTGNVTGNVTGSSGSTTGNAATATALATGRTIAITGDLAYTSPAFDGSGNVTAAGTLATVNSNVGSFGSSTAIPAFTVNGKGLITAASSSAVIAPAGTLTGATLASGVTTASINNLTAGLTTAGNIVATAADITAGGTVTGVSIVGSSAVQGAAFRTVFGSTSCPNSTATTIFAGTAYSSYWCYAYDATGVSIGVNIVMLNSTTGAIGSLNLAGNGITFGLSGLNVQVTQTTGSTKTISWAAIRIV